jgi:hypothetical protein
VNLLLDRLVVGEAPMASKFGRVLEIAGNPNISVAGTCHWVLVT